MNAKSLTAAAVIDGDTQVVRDVTLRPYRRDDLPGMVDVWNQRVSAEGEGMWATVEWFAESYDHPVRCDPAEDIVVAEDAADRIVGYARVTWEDVAAGYRSYPLAFVAAREVDGLEPHLLDWAEQRARTVAAGHAEAPDRRLNAEATDGTPRQQLLLDRGYVPGTRWGFMIHDLSTIPDSPLPAGLAARPVAEEHLEAIWDAQAEALRDDPDFVEPTEEDWEGFRDQAAHGTELWQVAWDGDRVVSQVRTRPAPDADNERRSRRRAWTEDISTRPAWRGRGVASALICASLRQLVELGYDEAALGADYESPTMARRLYERLGYRSTLAMSSYHLVI
jgi:GNAT superfamily N-acetyltransferase